MGLLKYIEDTFCMIFRPKVYEARLLAELDSIGIEAGKKHAEQKLGKKIMSKDDADMICLRASQTLSEFCDDKSSFKDMPVIKQARTVGNFLFNGEAYEKSYVSDRLNRVGKSSSANTYLNKKRKGTRQRD